MPLTLIAFILIIVILASVIFYVTRPLFTSQDEEESVPIDISTGRLETEYNDVLERIRELDFDFDLGKLTAEEHSDQRCELLARAAALRNQLKADEAQTGESGS